MPPLTPHQLADLRKSGLSDETIAAAGFYCVEYGDEIRKILNWDKKRVTLGECLAIPFYDLDGKRLDGYVRLKPSNPRKDKKGKPIKYESPFDQPNRVYFPLAALADLQKLKEGCCRLFITEGEKKSACATQYGFPAIGLVGVYGWCKPREKVNGKSVGEWELIEDLKQLSYHNNSVYVVFDSDAVSNDNVLWAEYHLADTLKNFSASTLIKVVRIPPGPPGPDGKPAKVGLDDFLIAHGADAFRALVEKSTEASKPRIACIVNCFSDEDGKKRGIELSAIEKQVNKYCEGWPKITGAIGEAKGTLFVETDNGSPRHLTSPSELFAWLHTVRHVKWANNADGAVTKSEFFDHIHGYTDRRFHAIERSPHFPPLPHHYYMHDDVKGEDDGVGDGRHLDHFLSFFKPATDVDAQLMKAFILTLFWGGPYGTRPAWLITGPDVDEYAGRGVGKTTFVMKCASLLGTDDTYIMSFNDPATLKSEDMEKRLLTPSARSVRVAVVDNLKSHNFSWALLEATITTPFISGRQMFVGEGIRPNNLCWAITVNGASLSRDMAQRCRTLKLARPAYFGGWSDAIDSYIKAHRLDIIADVAAIFRRPAPADANASRWALFDREILGRLGFTQESLAVLAARQEENDHGAEEMEILREGFMNDLRNLVGVDPERMKIRLSAKAIASIVEAATKEKRATNKAVAYARSLGIPELREKVSDGSRRWNVWQGAQASATSRPSYEVDHNGSYLVALTSSTATVQLPVSSPSAATPTPVPPPSTGWCLDLGTPW